MDANSWGLVIFLLLFALTLTLFRKRLHIQKILGGRIPIIYLALWRTKLGLKAMDRLAEAYPRALRVLSTIGIATGFVGMAFVTEEIIRNAVMLFITPSTTGGAALVLPIQAKGVVYVPFFIWIIALGIIIGIHEFGHGVIARLYKIPVKSSGLAALGLLIPLIPAAFVEPDEKSLSRRPLKQQLAVFAAGPFANIALGLLLLPLLFQMAPGIDALYSYQGITLSEISTNAAYPISQSGLVTGALITALDDHPITRVEDLTVALEGKAPGEIVTLTEQTAEGPMLHEIALGANPEDANAGYLGVIAATKRTLIIDHPVTRAIVFVYELILWLVALNIGVGLFNLLPVGIVDGGRMARATLEKYLHVHQARAAYVTISACCLGVVLLSVVMNFL